MRVSHQMVRLFSLFLTNAYADLSTLICLELGSSSDCLPSGSNKGGLGERCSGSKTLLFFAADTTSESWLSIVAMNDPNVASILALSSLKTFESFDWISKYTVAFVTSPFWYPSTCNPCRDAGLSIQDSRLGVLSV